MHLRSLPGLIGCLLLTGCLAQAGDDEVKRTANDTAAPTRLSRNRTLDEPTVHPFGSPFAVEGVEADPTAFATDLFPGAPVRTDDTRARAEVQRDLVLTLMPKDTRLLEDGGSPSLEVTLTNRSANRAWPVVLPSDGSDAGWREPWVFLTVERHTENGPWERVPEASLSRCGNYDDDWAKDVVTLAPGGGQSLREFSFAGFDDATEGADRIRVTAHYVYRQGNVFRTWLTASAAPDSMAGVPAFALSSEPVELMIERPLRIDTTLHALPVAGGAIEDLVTVTAENVSDHDVALPGEGGEILIELDGFTRDLTGQRQPARRYMTFGRPGAVARDAMTTLAPGQHVTLSSVQVAGAVSDSSWSYGVSDLRTGSIERVRTSYRWGVEGDIAPETEYPTEERHIARSTWQTFHEP